MRPLFGADVSVWRAACCGDVTVRPEMFRLDVGKKGNALSVGVSELCVSFMP
jgi:hypothetical protein